MNEPAIRTEEQIISLFPDRETQICQGWIMKKWEAVFGSTHSIISFHRGISKTIYGNARKSAARTGWAVCSV